MKKVIIYLFALLSLQLAAQTPGWQWAKSAGSNSNDGSADITTDPSGNTIVVGSFGGSSILFGSTVLSNAGNPGTTNDSYIAKYDSSGNVIWAKGVSGKDQDGAWAVKTDAAGNVYVIGNFKSDTISFGSATLVNTATNGFGTTDMYLAKYSPGGNLQWVRSGGGKSDEWGRDLWVDAGYIYITGHFQDSVMTLGGTTLYNDSANGNTSDIFLAKYDTAGTLLWAKREGGKSYDDPCNLTSDNAGHFYLSGTYWGPGITFGNTTLSNAGTGSFLVKYDTAGNVIWARGTSSITYHGPSSSVTDARGNTVIAGYFKAQLTLGTFTLTPAGGLSRRDMFLAKYDSAGNALWAYSGGGSDDDVALATTLDGQGNIYTAGYFYSSAMNYGSLSLPDPYPGSATYNFLLKCDSMGNAVWGRRDGSGGGTYLNAFTTTPSGEIYATGAFLDSVFVLGPSVLSNAATNYSSDMFLAKLDAGITSVSYTNLKEHISFYPNPAGQNLFITGERELGNITICNALGEQVLWLQSRNKQEELDIAFLPPGIYAISTAFGSAKFVKQ